MTRHKPDPRPDYVFVLRPEPSDVPHEIRVRRLLKIALRSFGLRCLHVTVTPAAGRPADASPATATSLDSPEAVEPANGPLAGRGPGGEQ